MMGDRNYRQIITDALKHISHDTAPKIDPHDKKTIHLYEVVRCLRRSYYDRTDPQESQTIESFNTLIGSLLQKTPYGSRDGEFSIGEIKLKGQADMIVDDIVFIFKTADEELQDPYARDILYLNACLWIYNKVEGIIVYLNKKGGEFSFSLTRGKNMFEETIRRVKVFSDLLSENKVPILEPSPECMTCQYYEKCFIKKKEGSTISIKQLVGFKDKEK